MERLALVFKRRGWWHRSQLYKFKDITTDYVKRGSLDDILWSIKLKDCYLVISSNELTYKAIPKEDLIIISKNVNQYLLTIR